MKKTDFRSLKLGARIFLITIFYLLTTDYCFAQTTDSVAAFTDKTTIGLTDIFPFQTKVSNKYTWRKITGANMFNRITDTTEARVTALLAASNSWTGINNFDGATFNADAHGVVTFNDSVVMGSAALPFYATRVYPLGTGGFIGTAAKYYTSMYANSFVVMNSGGTDSVVINVNDDGALSIPNLTVTETVTIDSAASFNVLAFEPHSFSIPNTTDTILTITSADRYSVIMLDLPGDVTPGISRIYVEGAQKGMVLRIYNDDAIGYCIFKDFVDSDDNLYMTANLTMNKYDYIEFMCVVESIIGQTWMETGRSNN